jgi:nitroreductase
MDLLETMAARHSVRSYKADAVEDQRLAQVLEAARLAPTAANRQPFRLIVLRTAGREEELRRISPDRRSGGRSTNW